MAASLIPSAENLLYSGLAGERRHPVYPSRSLKVPTAPSPVCHTNKGFYFPKFLPRSGVWHPSLGGNQQQYTSLCRR